MKSFWVAMIIIWLLYLVQDLFEAMRPVVIAVDVFGLVYCALWLLNED